MTKEICQYVVSLFESMRTPSGKLQGFEQVKSGSATPDAGLQPAITVAWDGGMEFVPMGNAALAGFRVSVSVYSSSLLTRDEGAAAHQQLICRPVGASLVGLGPAIARLTFESVTVSGQAFDVETDGETETFAAKMKSGNGWSYISIQKLLFKTLYNRSQIL